MFNVRMRAEKGARHISGAERLVAPPMVEEAVRWLARRALAHPNGEPDAVTISMRRITEPVLRIPPLPVVTPPVNDFAGARRLLAAEVRRLGLDADRVLALLYAARPMRGAMLLEVPSLRRLEPDQARGVRATCMDWPGRREGGKDHLREALCLASKVAHCPWIVGELCISDDPGYTTGYFASLERGYVRIPHIKEPGAAFGGRLFLFRGGPDDLRSCLDYLERRPVMVDMC